MTKEVDSEQRRVTMLYRRLDELRVSARRELDRARVSQVTGTPASLTERDALATHHQQRLANLEAVEDRLCFGRLDLIGGTDPHYIGRLGLLTVDQHQLQVDWRAPAAEPFYQATAAQPEGVIRRRHISSRSRQVTGLEDEVLDLERFDETSLGRVEGEGALMAALNQHRTGQMRDIVATIQQEQDRIIRSPLAGILVVQGGPGTGKTVVALHRVAYLLYTHRDRIARSGVLIVGPNRGFLSYIDQVLPSLGETGVVLVTPGQLLPGIEATAIDEPAVAAIKGDVRMARVIQEAVRARQRVPAKPITIKVDGYEIQLRPEDVEVARGRARSSRRPHNKARVTFVRELLNRLATKLARSHGVSIDEDNRGYLVGLLRENRDVRREVNLCWMPITPRQLLTKLFADPQMLAQVADHLSPAERELLLRRADAPLTTADVPLLDEAAELLGDDDSGVTAGQARAAAERATEVEYARSVLSMSGQAGSMMTAEDLVDRYSQDEAFGTVAERASDDRSWAFGHVVVDEAQELSAMAWRVIMRRCPSRSMTLVGDVAQTGSAAGTTSWAQVLDPYAADRWRLDELTVNYRTPRQIMDVAHEVLIAGGVDARIPQSVREGAWPPVVVQVDLARGAELGQLIDELVRVECGLIGQGTVAVIAPADRVLGMRHLVSQHWPQDEEEVAVSVLSVPEAKGLEFDSVILVAPDEIMEESARPAQDIYVAMTRPTQRLVIVARQSESESLLDILSTRVPRHD